MIRLLAIYALMVLLSACGGDSNDEINMTASTSTNFKDGNLYMMDMTTGYGGKVEQLGAGSWRFTSRMNPSQVGCTSVNCSKSEVKLYQEFCEYECLRHFSFDLTFEQIPDTKARWAVIWQTMSYMTQEGNPPPVALWMLPNGKVYLRVYKYPSHTTQANKTYTQYEIFEPVEGATYAINIDLLQTNRTGRGWVDVMVNGTLTASESGFNTFDDRVSRSSAIQWGFYHAGEYNAYYDDDMRYVLRIENMRISGY